MVPSPQDTTSHLILRAISLAVTEHQHQFRRDGVTPYAAHPLRVLAIMTTTFKVEDPETLAAAVLHDTLEDTALERDDLARQFGDRVAEYVVLLSRDNRLARPEQDRQYYEALARAPVEVKLCKLADVYDNLLDSAALSAASRAKRVRTARKVMALVAEDLAPQWQHALSCLQDELDAVSQAG